MSCTPLALGRSAPCSQQNSSNPECLLRLAASPPSTILNNSHYLRVHNGHVLNWTKLDFTLIAVASIFLHLLFAFNLGCVEFWHGVVFNFYGVESIDLHVISSIDFELKKNEGLVLKRFFVTELRRFTISPFSLRGGQYEAEAKSCGDIHSQKPTALFLFFPGKNGIWVKGTGHILYLSFYGFHQSVKATIFRLNNSICLWAPKDSFCVKSFWTKEK